MKAKRVVYSRLVSKTNYENAKIEIEMEVEDGEKANAVFNAAKEWVDKRVRIEQEPQRMIDQAQRVLADKRNHTLAQVEEAENVLNKLVINDLEELF